jgi:hypothetical protein
MTENKNKKITNKKATSSNGNAIALRAKKRLEKLTKSAQIVEKEIKIINKRLAYVPHLQTRLEKAKKRKAEINAKLEAEKAEIEALVKEFAPVPA